MQRIAHYSYHSVIFRNFLYERVSHELHSDRPMVWILHEAPGGRNSHRMCHKAVCHVVVLRHAYSAIKSRKLLDHSMELFNSGGGLWTIWKRARMGWRFHRGGSPSASSMAVIPVTHGRRCTNKEVLCNKRSLSTSHAKPNRNIKKKSILSSSLHS